MKTCAHCGSPFDPYRPNAKYCGPTCRSRAFGKRRTADGRHAAYRAANAEKLAEYNQQNRGKWQTEQVCVVCGSVWKTFRQDAKYCSRECFSESRRKPKAARPKYVRPLGLRELFEQERYDEAMASLMARTVALDSGCRVMKLKPSAEYPVVRWSKDSRRPVHRLVLWAKTRGSIEGWHAHHTCANASCVEPAHIVPATAAENVGEMLARRTYEAEIEQLRSALAELAPDHELLRRSLLPAA